MEYLTAAGFFVAVVVAYRMGAHDGRIEEQREEARRRQWQHRLDSERGKPTR
jgi:hypothetical protein